MIAHSWFGSALVALLALQGSICPLLCDDAGVCLPDVLESTPAVPCHDSPALPDSTADGSGEATPCLRCQEAEAATRSSAPVAAPVLLGPPVVRRLGVPPRTLLCVAALRAPPGRPPNDLLLLNSTLLL